MAIALQYLDSISEDFAALWLRKEIYKANVKWVFVGNDLLFIWQHTRNLQWCCFNCDVMTITELHESLMYINNDDIRPSEDYSTVGEHFENV